MCSVMSEFCIHRVKFFDYMPSAIQSLTFNRADNLLAVGREDNSVELWKIGEGSQWYQQKVIPGSEKRQVKSLVWVGGRLFSAGLQGDITEYDLLLLQPKKSVFYGNAFWCIAVNHAQTHIAGGCEDGYIRLYEITDEGLAFERSLQLQEGRIVSLAWHASDEVIVTGSLDNIRLWNVQSGHVTQRITTQRGQEHTQVVVWQVTILDDMTIVSGDSVGRTQFWNGKYGTLLQSYSSHRAAVLAICVSDDQTTLFSAGIDPVIAEFRLVTKVLGSEAKHWVRSRTVRDHTHDVRALAIAKDQLVSGGVDTVLSVNPSHLDVERDRQRQKMSRLRSRMPCSPQKPLVTLAAKARLLLFQFPYSLEVWKLGDTLASPDERSESLPLSEHPVKLLEMKSKSTEQVVCSALSSCGSWLAYSDVEKLRFYRITHGPLAVERVPTIPTSIQPSLHLAFTPDSSRLVSVTKTRGVQILTVDGPDGIDCPQPLVQVIPTGRLERPISTLEVSGDGQRIAVVGADGKVMVITLNDKQATNVVLPKTGAQPCCLAFHPSKPQLVLTYTDKTIAEYDFQRHEFTPWSKHIHREGLHRSWPDKPGVTRQVTYDPTNPERLLLHNSFSLAVVDKAFEPIPAESSRPSTQQRRKRGRDGTIQTQERSPGFTVCSRFKSIMFLGMLEDPGKLVIVERPHQAIMEKLPPTLQQKKFGT